MDNPFSHMSSFTEIFILVFTLFFESTLTDGFDGVDCRIIIRNRLSVFDNSLLVSVVILVEQLPVSNPSDPAVHPVFNLSWLVENIIQDTIFCAI